MTSAVKLLTGTPAALGYKFPPEWSAHQATWFSWPRPEARSFPGKYQTVPENLARIYREVALHERVEVNVNDAEDEHHARHHLISHGCPLDNIFFHHIPTNECWCRDHGPGFIVQQAPDGLETLAIVDWDFNSWGGKYLPFDDDNAVPMRMAMELGLPVFKPSIVMEGGSVDFNGAGVVLTSEQCLLNSNRNPGLSKSQIEHYLRAFYGQTQISWLGQGIAGDDTDGHVDDLARFVKERTIVIGVEDDPRDENYGALQDNLHRLQLLRDYKGSAFDIIQLPMPGVVVHNGIRLPATYVNFYFVNGALLVPTYRHPVNDQRALEILQRLLPDRTVIGIDCVELIWGRGAIHCLSQQQPAVGKKLSVIR